jgi:WD40 repeat protein
MTNAGASAPSNDFGYDLSWSPDSRRIAATGGQGISLFEVSTGHFSTVPHTDWLVNPNIVGWLDTGHIGVMVYAQPSQIPLCTPCTTPNPNPPPLSLVSVDVGTGKTRIVFTVSAVNMGSAEIRLSPDRTQALLVNHRFRDEPFTPHFELADLATGTLRPLPNLTQLGQSVEYDQIAWRPGAQMLAATGPGTDGHTQQWLIDLTQDSVTSFTAPGLVMGWSPDGTTLVTSTGYQAGLGSGPFDLNAVTFSPSGQAAVVLLTHDDRSFPFLGFVRNP